MKNIINSKLPLKRIISLVLVLIIILGLVACGFPNDPMLDDMYTRNIYPGTTNTYDIGSLALQYHNGYFENVWVNGILVGGGGLEIDPVFTASPAFAIVAGDTAWTADVNGIQYLDSVGIHTASSASSLLTLYSSDGITNDPVLSVSDNSASAEADGIHVNIAGAKTDYTDGIYISNLATTATAGADKYGLRIKNTGNWTGVGSVNNALYIETPTGGTTNYSIYSEGGLNYLGGATTLGSTLSLGGTVTLNGQTFDAGASNLIITTTGDRKGISLTSTSATHGVGIELYHNSASPAANDILMQIQGYGRNSTPVKIEYGEFWLQLNDPAAGTEDSTFQWYLRNGGAWNQVMYLTGAGALWLDNTLDMSGHQINNVADPALPQDAATKAYVDENINYAEMYCHENAVATEIQQINDWHLINGFTTGQVGGGWSFHTGEQLAITAYADNGDGNTEVTCAGHTLINTNIVSISGTTSYDGVWIVEQVAANTFVIDTPWVADDGASVGEHGSHFHSATTTSTGKYIVSYSLSIEPLATNCQIEVSLYYNATQEIKSESRNRLGVASDAQLMAGFSIIDVTVNGVVSIGIRNLTDTGDFTIRDGNVTLVKLD